MRAEAREHVDARNNWLAAHWNDLGTMLTSHAIDAGARRAWRATSCRQRGQNPTGRRAWRQGGPAV